MGICCKIEENERLKYVKAEHLILRNFSLGRKLTLKRSKHFSNDKNCQSALAGFNNFLHPTGRKTP
jgi:hypothetical protein